LLFYGQRAHEDFAFAGEHADWQRHGIRLWRVVSRAPATDVGAAVGEALAGYVQDALHSVRPDTRDAVAFVAGMKDMVGGVTQALAALGLPRERVHLNF
jgi:sulfite reductase alpha subunit-like flavoprotein